MLRELALACAFVLSGCAGGREPTVPPGVSPEPRMTTPSAEPAQPETQAQPQAQNATPAPKPRRKREPAPAVTSTMTLAKEPIVEQILEDGGAALQKVLAAPETYRFQIVYGMVEDGKLEQHVYRADAEYFFPASSMKMPIAFATLALGAKAGISREATLRLFAVEGDRPVYTTTIARETWRALIVSDNFAANRLLAIGGHREIHELLWSAGTKSARIRSGFATGDAIDPAEVSPKIEVADPPKTIAPRKSTLALPPNDATDMDIGKASIVDGRRVEAPLSFANKNAIRLRDLQDMLVRIVRPDLLPEVPGASLSNEDREYLQKALGTYPSESGLAGYDRNIVADYQHNPLLRGIERVRPRSKIKVYSKVGQAFGFLVANTYVVDLVTSRAFFLSAVVFANPDEVMNDDQYAYDSIAFPALADVGEVFTRHAFD